MAGLIREELDRLLLVGVNRRSLPPEQGGSLFGEEPALPRLLADLATVQPREAMVIATCERLELLLARGEDVGLVEPLLGIVARQAGLQASDVAAGSYCHEGAAAAAHVFAVAASLDSQMPGESQVLGQVKSCHEQARQMGMTGPILEALLQSAYGAAKRVRQETPLAEQSVSMAAVALQAARRLHGDLSRCSAVVVGLGEMGELLASELQRNGIAELVLLHPSKARSEVSARRLQCHFRAWEELPNALVRADILISDQGAGRWTATKGDIGLALQARRQRPMFLIDVALPRDIEDGVNDLDDAFLYNLDDLERLALEGHAAREAATERARHILEEERARFLRQSAERSAGPTVSALHSHFEATRKAALEESGGDADAATKLLVKRLLHSPSEVLRQTAAEGPDRQSRLTDALRRLFRLDQDKSRDGKG